MDYYSNWVFILTKDCRGLTERCLESVRAQDIPVSIMVADNASTDGCREMLKKSHPTILHEFSSPVSVARGWNFGVEYLAALGASHILILNADVYLRPDTYRELLQANGPFVTAVGIDDMEHLRVPFKRNDRPHPDFSCFLIRRDCWERVGPFDENCIGGYVEDSCYHVEMHRKGVRAISIGLPFYHYASGTLKTATPEERQRICQQADRNREYFERKYGCKIGGAEYEALFSDETFGMEAHAKETSAKA